MLGGIKERGGNMLKMEKNIEEENEIESEE